MSLHPQAFCPIPEETARVARAAYPKGNVYIQVRDNLGTIYDDQAFTHLFPNCGQPAEAPWRLAQVPVLQFAEGLFFSASGGCSQRKAGLEVSVGFGPH